MRLHTYNRREIQKATKGAKLLGIRIGGGRLTPPDPFKAGPTFPQGRIPARMPAPSILASLHRRAKRGDRARWLDVLATGAYIRTADGSIRKVRA